MDWKAVAFDWNQIRAFLVTAEEGSFSAAARALGQTQPTLGRQVAALEVALNVTLFERVGGRLELTQAGVELLEHVRAMGTAAARISLAATGQSQAIEGRVRITASDVMAAYVLPPALQQLRDVAPKLEIDIVATNDIRDILRREADIAIRHLRPEQPELIARLLSEATAHFYAATSYLARNGRPDSVVDLAEHHLISMGDPDQMIAHLSHMGIDLPRHCFRLGSESGLVAWEFVKAGLGIMIMSDQVGAATPGVERVLDDTGPVVFPVWLVTHRELHTSRRIRLVFDVLAAHMASIRS